MHGVFGKFKIMGNRDTQSLRADEQYDEMLINYDHIISVKPINILTDSGVIEGYWVRTSNGKKYRALEIPDEIKGLL